LSWSILPVNQEISISFNYHFYLQSYCWLLL